MELTDTQDSTAGICKTIGDGAYALADTLNEGRHWLGRKVDPVVNAIHPKKIFFPAKTIEKLFTFAGVVSHRNMARDFPPLNVMKALLPYTQALFALTGLNGLLNLEGKGFIPAHKKACDHHHDYIHQDHGKLNITEQAHLDSIQSLKFIKNIANVFDFSSGIFNCGFGKVLNQLGAIDRPAEKAMGHIHSRLMLPRNVLAFAFHLGVAAKDFSTLFSPSSENKEASSEDIKELAWKNGVPLARYGALLLPTLGLCTTGATAALAGVVSFGMASIQIFSSDFKNEDVGGGCC